ncbi:NAD(P)-dependent oxidoreductase [Clostridium sp. JS66]|uniref:NAD-dependent epimerase/dehydratase family protein n=1 Tax=Clostridium sp. JS66 TaxID=3064705 RepID=UPI00298EC6D9|nr:NAD(P)-dependent oxidoreductase [Clostridium sp. JS66]WPC41056.1 NAD(P)-dependent oxidoreductase [Clostridium sp. JS66]
MKKVLVTGASGFIGYRTVKSLLNKGYEVHAIAMNGVAIDKSIRWYNTNLLNKEEVFNLLKEIQPEAIIHFAWYTVPGKYNNSNENLLWLQASIELLKVFKEFNGKRFIFAGTCAQYDLAHGFMDEKITPSKPNSLYGICKHSFENVALEYCNKNHLSFVSGRIFYLYGERECEDRVIPYVINKLMDNEIAYCSHGNQIRDFMYIEDIANAFVEILHSNAEGIVNVGSGKPVRLKDIFFEIGRQLNKPELIHLGDVNSSFNEPIMIVANNNRLKTETNWIQRYSLHKGIEKTISWWKKG